LYEHLSHQYITDREVFEMRELYGID